MGIVQGNKALTRGVKSVISGVSSHEVHEATELRGVKTHLKPSKLVGGM